MGTYYNPGEEVTQVGRKLENRGFDSLQAQLQEGELLFSLADVFAARTNPLRALRIETEQDYIEILAGEVQNYYTILGFYALTREQAEKGCQCKLL